MQILFNIFTYILQHFTNEFNLEVVLFCLIFWLIRSVFKVVHL